MFLSVFDIFKIGIGPSSSHTVGPMVAAARFLAELRVSPNAPESTRIVVDLFGSLALTGKGHQTDRAVIHGLLGETPEHIIVDLADRNLANLSQNKSLHISNVGEIDFDPDRDIVFNFLTPLAGHPNGMRFRALTADQTSILDRTFYSVGGGFVMDEDELAVDRERSQDDCKGAYPHPFRSADEMLRMGHDCHLTIAQMKRANEACELSEADLDAGIDRLWQAMQDCIECGLEAEGELPGGLKVKRRAKALAAALAGTTLSMRSSITRSWTGSACLP